VTVIHALRRDAILRELRLHGAVCVSALAKQFGVTPITIRRDINLLAEQGLLTRVHGGATLPRREPAARPAPVPPRRGHRPLSIGMLVPSTSFYYRQVVHGAHAMAHTLGSRLTIGVSNYQADEDANQVKRLLDTGVDGLLLTPSQPVWWTDADWDWTKELPVPVVIVERRPHPTVDLGPFDFVATHHTRGTIEALRHLVARGHRRIGLLTTVSPTSEAIQQGFDMSADAFALPTDVPRVTDFQHGDVRSVDVFLDTVADAGVTAVLAHPDGVTTLLLRQARRRGLAVPDQLAIVSYDDELAPLAEIPLTAVEPDRTTLGRTAFTRLAQRIRQRQLDVPQETLLFPRLNVRASTGY
jgi:DNA-binding LacI/PurR family transcriptional regulator